MDRLAAVLRPCLAVVLAVAGLAIAAPAARAHGGGSFRGPGGVLPPGIAPPLLPADGLDAGRLTVDLDEHGTAVAVLEHRLHGLPDRDAEADLAWRVPPGARLLGATLERGALRLEATFEPAAAARARYREIVESWRDPLLVETTDEAGWLRVRCFPVPAGGHVTLRFRLALPVVDGVPVRPGRLQHPRTRSAGPGAEAPAAPPAGADRTTAVPALPPGQALLAVEDAATLAADAERVGGQVLAQPPVEPSGPPPPPPAPAPTGVAAGT